MKYNGIITAVFVHDDDFPYHYFLEHLGDFIPLTFESAEIARDIEINKSVIVYGIRKGDYIIVDRVELA